LDILHTGANGSGSAIIRLAICATHPIQYQSPLWRRLAATPGIKVEAFFGSDMSVRGYIDREFGTRVAWDTPLTDGYTHTFLSTDPRIQRIGHWTPNARGLSVHFRRFQPDVVMLTAYSGRFHLGAWRAARAVGAKIIIRHEASDVAASRSWLKNKIRDFLLRRFYTRIDGFAEIGTEARKHLLRLGVPESKLKFAPYCVDTDFFANEVTRWMPQREKIRAELGISPTDIALLFVGKLVAKKDPLLIPRALRLLPEGVVSRLHWIVVGDGDLRAVVEKEASSVLGSRIHFFGFMNQSEIGRAYAAGDLLVLPSRRGAGETWGLVVNEAMQFGLGALVSDGVGCASNLIKDDTGAVFPSGDAQALAEAMVISSSIPHEKTCRATRSHIATYSVANAAEGIRALVEAM
jgi:glycosyltransferase involved in cell wall biosynthesis